ncbi:MAG: hypothetical protein JWO32_2057 [Bacteroidetes bacterium]|nr:hypothetical protein [Bacteroidota bacterium]
MFSNNYKIAIRLFFLVTLLLIKIDTAASNGNKNCSLNVSRPHEILTQNLDFYSGLKDRPNPLLQIFKSKQQKNKKVIAAILAFPFPFGMVGLHRIYLGTSPHVPVVYIGTLGGALGILPFIDFCVIVLDKDLNRYIENKKVLMWVDESKKEIK